MYNITMELREIVVNDLSAEVEEVDLNEYLIRLMISGAFDKKLGKRDNNSVGHCWYRAHAARLGVYVNV